MFTHHKRDRDINGTQRSKRKMMGMGDNVTKRKRQSAAHPPALLDPIGTQSVETQRRSGALQLLRDQRRETAALRTDSLTDCLGWAGASAPRRSQLSR